MDENISPKEGDSPQDAIDSLDNTLELHDYTSVERTLTRIDLHKPPIMRSQNDPDQILDKE